MKEYRVSVIDFNAGNGKVIVDKYVKGIKEARAICPSIKAHYSYNAKAFIGWNGKTNLIIKEV